MREVRKAARCGLIQCHHCVALPSLRHDRLELGPVGRIVDAASPRAFARASCQQLGPIEAPQATGRVTRGASDAMLRAAVARALAGHIAEDDALLEQVKRDAVVAA